MKYYIQVIKKYAVFSGRATRQEFWMFFLFNIVISIVLSIIENIIGTTYTVYASTFPVQEGYIGTFYSLAVFIPSLAVQVRRLHDVNKSGWMVLLPFVPLIPMAFLFISGQIMPGAIMCLLALAGGIWVLVLLCTAGTMGKNKYGSDPERPEPMFSFEEGGPQEVE